MPGPPDEKPYEGLLVTFIDHHTVIVDGRLDNDLLDFIEISLEDLVVSLGDFVGLGEDRRTAFHVDESHRTTEFEFQLQRIEQMKRRDVVFAETQVLKTAPQLAQVHEKIGDD